MVGAAANDAEMLLGYTADGMYEIVLRLGKFFFRKNFVLLKLSNFLIGLMYRV